MNLLLAEIDWDAPAILARSLPQMVLILNAPNDLCPESDEFQNKMKQCFGFGTTGLIGDSVESELKRSNRLQVDVICW